MSESKRKEKNHSSYKKLFSNTLVFAIGSFSSKVLVLLLIPIYTNYLNKAELGVTDILTQIANWIIPLATMTISEAIIRFGLDKAYNKKKVFMAGNIICMTGLAVFGIVLPIIRFSGVADRYIGGYSIILYLYIFMSGFKTLYTTFVRAMEKVQLFALAGIVATFLTLIFTALFYMTPIFDFLGFTGIEKYLLATVISDFLTTVFVIFSAKLWRFIDFRMIDKKTLREMLFYSIPLIPAQLSWLVTNSSDTFMTTHYMGEEYTGLLSSAYKIPNIVATVYMMFGQAWNMSAITENDSDDRDKFYENVFDFNQSLLYILAAGCLLIIQPLTRLMIGSDFQECINYSPILIYSTIFSCFTTFMGSIYLAAKKTNRSFFTSLIAGVINIGLNIILIPTIGLYGPPISTVVSYLAVFIVRAYDSRKLVPFRLGIKKIIVNNIIILAMLSITLVYTNLFKHMGWYLVLLILFLIVFVMNMGSVNSLLYKLLPAKIADKLTSLNKKKLVLGAVGLIAFLVLNWFTAFLPLLLVLVVSFVIGIIKNKFILCLPGELFFLVTASVQPKYYIELLAVFVISILPMLFRFKKFKQQIIYFIVFDAFVFICFNALAAVFAALAEILILVFIYRKTIMNKAIHFAYKKR